ncbi:ATP-binding protein [Streptomyces sp. NBC_00690]|uniref:ATP-binding protein n=1 Tax=Streptomyces sp. NBC_00690 TaxID=2975808 RepID=UPI002E2B25C3|nr:ATP-binding protein [Streptomyces sp. NBC_00690]
MSTVSGPASWRIALPHTAAAVPMARALIRTAWAELAATADSATAELLTAELVANAVEHTHVAHPISLVVQLLPTGWRVEVHDGGPMLPGQPPPHSGRPVAPWCENGRGLLLVRALSSDCGQRPTAEGKAMWFTLRTTGP